ERGQELPGGNADGASHDKFVTAIERHQHAAAGEQRNERPNQHRDHRHAHCRKVDAPAERILRQAPSPPRKLCEINDIGYNDDGQQHLQDHHHVATEQVARERWRHDLGPPPRLASRSPCPTAAAIAEPNASTPSLALFGMRSDMLPTISPPKTTMDPSGTA